jgi:hypothetical protein
MSLTKQIWICSSLAIALAGCGQHDEIARYTVEKPEVVDPTLTATSASASPAAKTEQQTIGLIVPLGDVSWFFKLTGEREAVETQHEAFVEFVGSIKLSPPSDPKPTWTLPSGWQQLPGSQFRYATIRIPGESGEKPLEISVSSAGGDVLSNVNRWRGQLSLKPISADGLKESTKSLKVDGHDAILVKLVGTGSGGMSGAPFAPFAGGQLPPDHPPIDSSKNSPSK